MKRKLKRDTKSVKARKRIPNPPFPTMVSVTVTPGELPNWPNPIAADKAIKAGIKVLDAVFSNPVISPLSSMVIPLSTSGGMRPHDTIRANTERNPDGHSVEDSSASRASRRVNPAG